MDEFLAMAKSQEIKSSVCSAGTNYEHDDEVAVGLGGGGP